MSDEEMMGQPIFPVLADTEKTTQPLGKCTTPHCPGDPHYASPGRGHLDVCPYPMLYDGDEIPEWREHEPMLEALPAFMTIVLLFGAAVQGATRDQRQALYEARLMLGRDKAPLPEVAQAILNARGPDWVPPPETMQAIEALHNKEDV